MNKYKEGIFLNVDNGVPIDCRLTLALINPVDGTSIPLINGNQIIQAAEIDAFGKVTQPKSSVIKIELSRSLIDEILRTKKVKVCAVLTQSLLIKPLKFTVIIKLIFR